MSKIYKNQTQINCTSDVCYLMPAFTCLSTRLIFSFADKDKIDPFDF